MNIAKLETAVLSGKFRELRTSEEVAAGKGTSCRDKLSEHRTVTEVNWLSSGDTKSQSR